MDENEHGVYLCQWWPCPYGSYLYARVKKHEKTCKYKARWAVS